jgi:hypothetical protein
VKEFEEWVAKDFDSHECLQTIETYLANSPELRCKQPDLITPDVFKKRYGNVISHKTEEIRRSLVGITQIKNFYAIFTRGIEKKIVATLNAIVTELNDRNYFVLALCTRSVMEHAACLTYLNLKCEETKGALEHHKSDRSLNEKIERTRSELESLMVGTRFFGEENRSKLGLKKSVNVMTMLEHSNKIADGMLRNYELLSDLVHPNCLNNLAVITEGLQDWTPLEEQVYQQQINSKVLDALNGTLLFLEVHTPALFWTFIEACDKHFQYLIEVK